MFPDTFIMEKQGPRTRNAVDGEEVRCWAVRIPEEVSVKKDDERPTERFHDGDEVHLLEIESN